MLKSFVAFKPSDVLSTLLRDHLNEAELFKDFIEEREIQMPDTSAWQSIGFSKLSEYGILPCSQDVGLLTVTIADRILPGSVIKAKVNARVREIEHKETRKLGKKEIMQIKDQVLPDLLAKSHIRTKVIPVIINPEIVIIGSSSVRIVDEVAAFLNGMFMEMGDDAACAIKLFNMPHFPAILNAALLDSEQYDYLQLGDKLALSSEKGVMKFSQTDLTSDAVKQHLKGSWHVNSIQLKITSGDDDPRFVVDATASGIFRGFKPYGILTQSIKDELGDDTEKTALLCASTWLYFKEIKQLFNNLTNTAKAIDNEDSEL